MHQQTQRRFAVVAIAAAAATMLGSGISASAATPAPSRTVLSTTTANVAIGGTAHLKAVVKPVTGAGLPIGNVVFKEGATVLGTVALSLVGVVQTAKLDVPGLALGSHSVIATYVGSPAFATSTSLPVIITVAKTATTTTLSSTTPLAAPGSTVKLKAVVKVPGVVASPTGNVTFTEGATVLGTVALALVGTVETAKLSISTLSNGDHSIVATYGGSATYLGSASAPVTITVAKPDTTTTITPVAVAAVPGKYNLNAVIAPVPPATGFPTGVVTFVIDANAPQVLALNGTARASIAVTFVVGTVHTVTVTYAGDSKYIGSTGTVTFTA